MTPITHGVGSLPPDLAHAADQVIETMLNVAAREVTATRCPLAAAMRNAWGHLAADTPEVWALAILRLEETHNDEMLAYATLEDAL
jgi:hypothetical protein